MSRHRLVLAALVVLGAAACSSPSNDAQSQALRALIPPTTSTTTPRTTATPPGCADPTQSFRPDQPLPVPGDMPAGTLRAIQDRGMLIVGVDQGTLDWGYRDPRNGNIDGLDVDLLRAIARAIFGGDPDAHLQFKTLTTAQRVSAVADGKVDMVASLLTATCARWGQVDFSTTYYDAHQDVLVPTDSTVTEASDLAGKTVCATRGSTSLERMHALVPTAKISPVDTRADCLVALQDGRVDAVTSDDTILASFQAQEQVPHTRTLGHPLSVEPYAIAMQKHHEDLVRFVNAVLDRMRADGSLTTLYDTWLHQNMPPPPAVYGR